jgi:hypothetical protein
MRNKKLTLYDTLKASYKPNEDAYKLKRYGYDLDKSLSNDNQQVWYNPKKNKLLYTIAGTHNLNKDVGTDIYLGLGKLKSTNRYKEADMTLKKAQEKYKPKHTDINGHSLGSSIAMGLHNRGDTKTLDGGFTIGQKVYGEHFRHARDVVSFLSPNDKHNHQIRKNEGFNPFYTHNVDRIKSDDIVI